MEQLCDGMWACYILRSFKKGCNKTYIGSTNSTVRRIRQHNGIKSGGAKASACLIPSEMFCIVTGFLDHKAALRCEWLLKHPMGRKKGFNFSGVGGRIRGLNYLLSSSDKWKERSNNCNLIVWIKKDCFEYLDAITFGDNITINVLDS